MDILTRWLDCQIDAYLSNPTRQNEAAVYLVVLLYVLLAVPWLAVKRIK